jgi:hypothetical protein
MKAYTASLIIASERPPEQLKQLLVALQQQENLSFAHEVLWVRHGAASNDAEDMPDMSPNARCLRVPGMSTTVAWNKGAAAARGEWLVFLSDDYLPGHGWLAGHIAAQQHNAGCLVFGPARQPMPRQAALRQLEEHRQYEAHYHQMQQAGHRYQYRDIVSGNISLPAELLHRIGYFRPQLSAGNGSYDLAIRWLNDGQKLQFSQAAEVFCRRTRVDAAQQAWWEGHEAMLLAQYHPPLRQQLEEARQQALQHNQLLRRMQRMPDSGDWLARQLHTLLAPLETLNLRRQWRKIATTLADYWYWRGVVDTPERTLRSKPTLVPNRQSAVEDAELCCDLAPGLAAVAARIDEQQPVTCRLLYGGRELGHIDTPYGMERLRGAHLQPILAGALSTYLLAAMATETTSEPLAVSKALAMLQEPVARLDQCTMQLAGESIVELLEA